MASETTSRAIVLTGVGSYDKLQIQEVPINAPKDDQVRVKVEACGLNFADLMMRQGLYKYSSKPPCVQGMECAGIVEAIGDHVTDLKIGQRVICATGRGAWSEHVVASASHVVPMPDGMSFEEGAAIPVNYLSAYLMLFRCAHLKEGQSVLIHMAAGGVGIAATQLAKSVPNVTLFGTASASKHAVIKEYGIDYPIDYRTTDYEVEVRKISPDGVDIVLDPLAGKDFKKGFNLLRPLGVTVLFGAANLLQENKGYFNLAKQWFQTTSFDPFQLMEKNRTVSGFLLSTLTAHPDTTHAMKELVRLYNEGVVKPRVDSVFSFEEIAKAQKRIHDRLNVGKIILVPRKTKTEPSGDADAKTDEKPVENGEKSNDGATENETKEEATAAAE